MWEVLEPSQVVITTTYFSLKDQQNNLQGISKDFSKSIVRCKILKYLSYLG